MGDSVTLAREPLQVPSRVPTVFDRDRFGNDQKMVLSLRHSAVVCGEQAFNGGRPRADDYAWCIMTGPIVSVGLVQQASLHDKSKNLAHACEGIRDAARQGASLVVLQELFATDYFCQTEDPKYFEWAEPLEGPTVNTLSALARELEIIVVAPLFERRGKGLYHNTLMVIGADGSNLGVYRKMHIPQDPQFCEKFYFTPGSQGFSPIPTPLAVLGTLICWDQWFPEAARVMALAGAEILAYPTAIGWIASEKQLLGPTQLDAWKTVQRSHAIANAVFVIAVNRVGKETMGSTEIEFWGHSFVCDPMGRLIAEAGEQEQVLVVPCDLGLIAEQRHAWPFFRDRRIDAYDGLLDRWIDDAEEWSKDHAKGR
jgi:N-carbamoylputrescine amidase